MGHSGTKIITGGERQTDGSIVNRRRGNKLKEFGSRFNVWVVNTGYGKSSSDKIAFHHPAIMPEQIAKGHIFTCSNENDLVYDPFSGSGTTLKMAHLLKRNWIGSELSVEYCDIINKRMHPYLIQTILL